MPNNPHSYQQTRKQQRVNPAPNAMTGLGTTGLRMTNGFVREEFISDLQGQDKFQIFEEMRKNDAIVAGALRAISMLLRQVDWKVVPGGEDRVDLRRAEFLRDNRRELKPGWDQTLDDIITMIDFGFSIHEKIYRRRESDNRIVWARWPIRRQESVWQWDVDDVTGKVNEVTQLDENGVQSEIPREKLLHFKASQARGNPEGVGVLRHAYRAWYQKKRVEEIELIGVERDLAGLPIAHVPPEILDPSADSDKKNILNRIRDIVVNVRRDEQEGIVFPRIHDEDGNSLYEFDLLSSGGERQFDTSEIVERLDLAITISMLADFLKIGHEQHGSFALASSKTDTFSVAIGAWLDVVQEEINENAVRQLFELNGMSTENLPRFQHADIESQDPEVIGTFFNELGKAGIIFNNEEKIRNKLMDLIDFPRPENENPDIPQQQEEVEQPDGNQGLSIGQSIQ